MRCKSTLLLSLITFSLISPACSRAGGYELLEQSGESVGLAYAGAATGYGDASEVFFNPGALTELTGTHASAGVIVYVPRSNFKDEGSRYIDELGGGQISGLNSQRLSARDPVPNLYLSHQVSSSTVLGLGMNSPFGLSTEFDSDWIGRYHSIESSLSTVNINPAIGTKISDSLSLGFLSQLIYAKAKLKDALDFGAIGASVLGSEDGMALGLMPGLSDGLVSIEGDDWGFGYGVGVLYKPLAALKLGLTYRAPIKLRLSGDADFEVPENAQFLTAGGSFQDTAVLADLTLPETLTVGAAYSLNGATSLLLDATWVRWTRYDNLVLDFSGLQPDSVERDSWDNSVRIATGVKYRATERTFMKVGIAWDPSPIKDEQHLSPRIPDADHFWLSGGISYKFSEDLSLGLNYSHLFTETVHTLNAINETGALLNGKWSSSGDIFAIQINWQI